MPSHHTLVETEAAVTGRLANVDINADAMHAVSSIHRAANASRNHMTNTVLRPHDLSWTGFVVLWSVWIFDNPETREVADSAGISKATLSGVVKTLVGRGWLERTQSTTDKRFAHLSLTPAGQTLMDEVFPEFNAYEQQLVADLTPEELAVLTKALRKVVTTTESLGDPNGE
jgi:DNA-binding MarR family transcriptional regulator